jgi:hypothetical protein
MDLEFQMMFYQKYLNKILQQRIDLAKGKEMDAKIKSAKKSIDKKMDKLVVEDKKRDKKCEHEKMEKMEKIIGHLVKF